MLGLPYIEVPTWHVELPFVAHTFSIFGLTATAGVFVGFHQMLRYARARGMDEKQADSLAVWVTAVGFVAAHWVSVLFYYPEQVWADPWILLRFWQGISSVGGFIGGSLCFTWLTWRRGISFRAHADAMVFGLLPGITIGRLGCALVHDHPGAIADGLLAVGPWPDGSLRYDLGLIEFSGLVVLTAVVLGAFAWRSAAPGRLTAFVAITYAMGRFPLDFLRAADQRYLGLTPAQFACLGFLAAGILLWVRTSDRDPQAPRRSKQAR